jgi:hypothetical protein
VTTTGNLLQNYFSRLYIPRITWTDIIEIIIIAVVLYNILLWIMNTKAWALLKGIIVVALFAVVAYLLNLKTILWIAGKTISVGIIALVIIFQPELRRALEQLGRKRFMLRFFNFGVNLKYKRYIRSTTHNAISANSTDIVYRCASINKDNITIVKPTGRNAQITDISTTITGLLSFSIYPMLALSIKNETSATINFKAGTRYVSYLL